LQVDNMSVWPPHTGPSLWYTIHSIALCYPNVPMEFHKKAAQDFIESLAYLHPCIHCQQHIRSVLKEMPLKIDSKIVFFEWTVAFHNSVNRRLGKYEFTLEEAYDKYFKLFLDKSSIEPLHINQVTIKELNDKIKELQDIHREEEKKQKQFRLATIILAIVVVVLIWVFFFMFYLRSSKRSAD
jgi:hypothetical protein